MSRFKPYLKVAAVVSAVSLSAVLIAYRAGAFARFTRTAEPTHLPSSKSFRAIDLVREPDPQPFRPEFLSGSKFGPVVTPTPVATGAAPAGPEK